MSLFAVIMAGGAGTRFWPASRERLPKQFLKITSDRTLFEETIARVARVARSEHTYIVTNAAHADLARTLSGASVAELLAEPMGRNTAACIGLAALHINRRDGAAPIIALPSDHFVADADGFAEAVRAGAEVARSGAIVTLGITPTRPETGYGYIKMGAERGRVGNTPYYTVEKFVEKPNQQTALSYLAAKQYLWNSGIFIFTAKTILSEIEANLPSLAAGLREIERAINRPDYAAVVEAVYRELDSVSVDYGIMEKAKAPMCVLKAEFGWSDVGSWQALYDLRREDYDEQSNLLLGDALAVDSKRNLVYSTTDRLISLLGVEGLVIVDTPDALLIADMNRSQDVRLISERLRRNGRAGYC
ncbi:MAG TPA: mannose-1-phosphate guanylyltransferase [Blastocatellia bacterium]|nr:mannose-1-phosphate guanylyltransferase [Blastocatellia bacterium]